MQNQIYTFSATTRVYVQSPCNPLEISTILVKSLQAMNHKGLSSFVFSDYKQEVIPTSCNEPQGTLVPCVQ